MSAPASFIAEWGPWLAIAGMAAITYLWRVAGFFAMGFVTPHPRITRALAALPGSVILATVLPVILKSGPAAPVAVVIAMVAFILRRNDFLACACGLLAAILIRQAGF